MAEFKDMLTFYRKRDNLTQQELASKLHISTSTIGMYELGKRYPTREIEEALADLFNVNLDTLRGKTETYSKPDESIVADFIFDRLKNKYIRKLHDVLGDITEEEGEELILFAEFLASKRRK